MQPDPTLRHSPPTADVIPFPAKRRVGKIRRTAELIHGNTKRAATAHWHRTISDIARQMARAGVPDERIERELRDFHRAVEGELARRSRSMARMDDGEIA